MTEISTISKPSALQCKQTTLLFIYRCSILRRNDFRPESVFLDGNIVVGKTFYIGIMSTTHYKTQYYRGNLINRSREHLFIFISTWRDLESMLLFIYLTRSSTLPCKGVTEDDWPIEDTWSDLHVLDHAEHGYSYGVTMQHALKYGLLVNCSDYGWFSIWAIWLSIWRSFFNLPKGADPLPICWET